MHCDFLLGVRRAATGAERDESSMIYRSCETYPQMAAEQSGVKGIAR
jgi:hypothetical protein